MEVNLPPELETKLARLASRSGIEASAAARTAIETFVDHDDWFVGEVEKGLEQIRQGALLTHEAVGVRLDGGRKLASE